MTTPIESLDERSRERYPITDFYEEQHARIVSAFGGAFNNSVICVGSADDLWRSVPFSARATLRVARGPATRNGNILVVAADGQPTRIWARAGYTRYRPGLTRSLTALQAAAPNLDGYDVDHSAARGSIDPNCLVELFIVPRSVNRAWGSAAESLGAKRARRTRGSGGTLRPIRTMQWAQAAKLLGIKPPPKPRTNSMWAAELADALYGAGVRGFSDHPNAASHKSELAEGIQQWHDAERVLAGR